MKCACCGSEMLPHLETGKRQCSNAKNVD